MSFPMVICIVLRAMPAVQQPCVRVAGFFALRWACGGLILDESRRHQGDERRNFGGRCLIFSLLQMLFKTPGSSVDPPRRMPCLQLEAASLR